MSKSAASKQAVSSAPAAPELNKASGAAGDPSSSGAQVKHSGSGSSAGTGTRAGGAKDKGNARRHGPFRCLWRFFKYATLGLFLLLALTAGALYYFLFTLSGARQGLSLAQTFIPQSIIIDTTIESGSVFDGLVLGKTLVDIKDVVTITADDLTLKYDLKQMQQNLFKVNVLESSNLNVALSDAIFAPKEPKPEEPSTEPFRLSFPVDIDIDRFALNGFSLNSQIVDVDLDSLSSALWARQDNLGTKDTLVDGITVHLKNQQDVAAAEAQAVAATQVEESLAISVDGQITELTDLEGTVNAVVAAAQQGKSVEMVIVRETAEREANATEKQILQQLKPITTEEIDREVDEARAAARSNNQDIYSDPEVFAKAIEDALLNGYKTPAFVNARPVIHDPYASKFADAAAAGAATDGAGAKAPEVTAADAAVKTDGSTVTAVEPTGDNTKRGNKGVGASDSRHLEMLAAVSKTKLNIDDFERRLLSDVVQKKSEATDITSVDGVSGASGDYDGVSGATADSIAAQARNTKEQRSEVIVATASKAIVKEFGSGNGAIAEMPKIVLPFNIKADNFVIKRVRYYMEGFDTREADVSFSAAWKDTNLVISDFKVSHEFGQLNAVGDLNFDRYFDLDFELQGEGFKNDSTHDFMQGLLYGLNGSFKVSGDLTDLRVQSTLNLGGSSELMLHANVLSGAMPLMVELTTRDFTYPVFGEPLVNVQQLDFKGSGNLVDGVDIDLNGRVSGFDFKDVVTRLSAQISYEKSHIDFFEVDGTYLEEKLAAKVSGDVFYGSVLGVDARVFAQVKDAGFVSPLLKGPLKIDSDLVAILNQKDKAPSAVSVASAPAYLEHRIPKTTVMMEDFNADSIESMLLAQVKSGNTVRNRDSGTTVIKAETTGNSKEQGAQLAAQGKVPDNKAAAKEQAGQLSSALASATEEEILLSGSNNLAVTKHAATDSAIAAVNSGKSLAVVRPLQKPLLLAGGVADGPHDLLITPEEYVEAVRFSNDGEYSESEKGFLYSIFNQDLPEIMTNIRFIKGSFFFNGVKSTVDIQDIVGDLHQGFRVDLLKVTQGENVVIAEGQVTERGANLNALIDIKDLSTIAAGVKGKIAAYINSSGSIHDLNFELSGSAPQIRSGDMVVRKLVFNAGFNMQTRALNFTAMADRLRLVKAMAANRQCFIDISGTPLRHNISANCGGAASGYLSVDGSLNYPERTYSANLLELYLSTESAGSLSLSRPVFVDVSFASGVQGTLTPLELKGEIGQILLSETRFSPDYTKSHLSVTELNLSSLSDFFPEGVKMQVPLNMEADVLVDRGNPDIKVKVDSTHGVIYSTVGAGLVYETFTFDSHITRQIMRNNFNMVLRRDGGVIESQLDIKDPMGKGVLGGYFRITDFDLKSISNIGQSFNELKGFANVDTTFGGDISKPMIYGKIALKGDAIPRYDVGQINEFDINMALSGQQGRLDGKVVLNGKDLTLGGDLDWSEGANGTLSAQARELPLFLVGYGTALANLDAHIALGEVLDVQGKVEIPSAMISISDVSSSGVGVSADEIIVPESGTSALMQKAPSNMKTALDLEVAFGDDVRFSALGMVEGRLGGKLIIYKEVADQDVRGEGEINIVDGEADIYGRKFGFDLARIMFHNDITNPSLNIEVTADRDFLEDDVDVGVRVTGNAQAPDIKLFSKPMMSQNEILSYILYGHGLEKSALQQDSNNSNMLLGLGVSSLSGIASSLASSFGVKDIQLGTQGTGDEMQVSVQGYVTRRLRLSYGYGVFNAVGEFKVRYELFQSLYAEFVSSIDQAVDLIYSFEFD